MPKKLERICVYVNMDLTWLLYRNNTSVGVGRRPPPRQEVPQHEQDASVASIA
jgi:hypothetical protein